MKKLRTVRFLGPNGPKKGFWTWKEAFRGDAVGSRDSNKSAGGQSEPTESIVGWVGRGEEHLDLVWIPVAKLVIWGPGGVHGCCCVLVPVIHD